ncbi:MAG: amidase family protein [Acetobacteraceae bacterium]|nr:amidase family protein [Acetobacteraceae bacterium]
MKPSYGLVPRTGVFPLAWSLDHLGPLARTAEDCAILLSACAGHDPDDPASDPRPAPDLLGGLSDGVRGLRIGIPQAWLVGGAPLTPATQQAVDRAEALFRAQGAITRPIDLPPLQDFTDAGMLILLGEAFALHAPWLRARRDDYGEILRERLLLGALVSAEDYRRGAAPTSGADRSDRRGDARGRPDPHRRCGGRSAADRCGRSLDRASACPTSCCPSTSPASRRSASPPGSARRALPVAIQLAGQAGRGRSGAARGARLRDRARAPAPAAAPRRLSGVLRGQGGRRPRRTAPPGRTAGARPPAPPPR